MSATSIRLFIETPLGLGAQAAVSEAQAHYLANVMRVSTGDSLRVFNAADGEW